MTERWLPVVGYEDCYEVSDQGRVRSVERFIKNRNGYRRIRSQVLVLSKNPNGYLQVSLWKDNRGLTINVHVLVARAFLGGSPLGHEVAHLDGTRNNNRVENLTYTTRKINHSHKKLHGTHRYGETHHSAKLTGQDIDDIEILRSLGATQQAIADEFAVSRSNISMVLNRKTWSHLPL